MLRVISYRLRAGERLKLKAETLKLKAKKASL
jgi:hypothetical protein